MPGSRSKVEFKVMGQGQSSRSNLLRTAVDIRESALPSAAKSYNMIRVITSLGCFMCVCNQGRMRIIARMRLVGF